MSFQSPAADQSHCRIGGGYGLNVYSDQCALPVRLYIVHEIGVIGGLTTPAFSYMLS